MKLYAWLPRLVAVCVGLGFLVVTIDSQVTAAKPKQNNKNRNTGAAYTPTTKIDPDELSKEEQRIEERWVAWFKRHARKMSSDTSEGKSATSDESYVMGRIEAMKAFVPIYSFPFKDDEKDKDRKDYKCFQDVSGSESPPESINLAEFKEYIKLIKKNLATYKLDGINIQKDEAKVAGAGGKPNQKALSDVKSRLAGYKDKYPFKMGSWQWGVDHHSLNGN